MGALEAKKKKDKKSHGYFGDIIRKLKQEISSLGCVLTAATLLLFVFFFFHSAFLSRILTYFHAGLSDDILVSSSQDDCLNLFSDEMSSESIHCITCEQTPQDNAATWEDLASMESETVVTAIADETPTSKTENTEDGAKKEEAEDMELDNLFSEDSSSLGQLPSEVLKQQKKENISQLASGRTLVNVDEIWKKVLGYDISSIHNFSQ